LEERLNNFRSRRRGIQAVVREIEVGTFGNAYRRSSLETVVHLLSEQRQLFNALTTRGFGSRSSTSRISTSP
jgi:hypothetical protein